MIRLYAFVAKGIKGAPAGRYRVHLTKHEADRPGSITWGRASAWTLTFKTTSAGVVMISIRCVGQPEGVELNEIFNQVKSLTGRMLR